MIKHDRSAQRHRHPPTPAMRRAMAEAEVGDDVYGEDPTVNRLEQRAAEILGKEAGLFVPTGTMGNTIAIKVHTEHGQEVICESRAHILDWELSMTAWFSGCLVRPIHAEDGILRWNDIRDALAIPSPHCAPTGLIEIENTHNMAGGTVYPLDVLHEICDNAHDAGIKVHMDGARIFNAACHLNLPVRELAAPADTVMFCLSKGLGAPAGSMLVGHRRSDRARPAVSQASGRRHAASGRAGGGRTDRARRNAEPAGRRSRQCAFPGRGTREAARIEIASGARPDQYRRVRCQRDRVSTPANSARG